MMEDTHKCSIEFIKNHLIPEMVYNRCFCESGSREYIELDSVNVESWGTSANNKYRELYRGNVTIKFSSEPTTFHVIIKLLPLESLHDDTAYNRFLNEEMFYNKTTAQYQLDIYPKCYAADMGRYERPVVVLENLEAAGYISSAAKLNEDHLRMYLKLIARFHGRGFKLKHENFQIFQELYVKLSEAIISSNFHVQSINKVLKYLQDQKDCKLGQDVKSILGQIPNDLDGQDTELYTICHGNLDQNHLLFRYEDGKPVDLKILGWNRLKYSLPGIDLQFINVFFADTFVNGLDSAIIELFNYYFSILTKEWPQVSRNSLI